MAFGGGFATTFQRGQALNEARRSNRAQEGLEKQRIGLGRDKLKSEQDKATRAEIKTRFDQASAIVAGLAQSLRNGEVTIDQLQDGPSFQALNAAAENLANKGGEGITAAQRLVNQVEALKNVTSQTERIAGEKGAAAGTEAVAQQQAEEAGGLKSDFEVKEAALAKSLGRELNEAEKLSAGGASVSDPIEIVLLNGEPTLVKRSEVDTEIHKPFLTGMTLTLDENGKLTLTQGPIGSDAGGPTAALSNEIRAQLDFTQAGEEVGNQILKALDETPEIFGVGGTVRRSVGTTVGVLEDLTNLIPGIGTLTTAVLDRLEPALKESIFNPDLSRVEVMENALAVGLAATRKPPGTRAFADVYRVAKKEVALTGLTGSRQIKARIQEIVGKISEFNRKAAGRQEVSGTQPNPAGGTSDTRSDDDVFNELIQQLEAQ